MESGGRDDVVVLVVLVAVSLVMMWRVDLVRELRGESSRSVRRVVEDLVVVVVMLVRV